jgi:FKBP-type peptidyl-prolyl cis-trans isomerase
VTPHAAQVVPAFENVVDGLTVGDTRKLRSEPADCYGEWRQDMFVEVPKEVRITVLDDDAAHILLHLSNAGSELLANSHQLAVATWPEHCLRLGLPQAQRHEWPQFGCGGGCDCMRERVQGTPAGLEAGVAVQLSNGARAVVKDVTDSAVVLDANHELAGKALTFDVELMGVAKAI